MTCRASRSSSGCGCWCSASSWNWQRLDRLPEPARSVLSRRGLGAPSITGFPGAEATTTHTRSVDELSLRPRLLSGGDGSAALVRQAACGSAGEADEAVHLDFAAGRRPASDCRAIGQLAVRLAPTARGCPARSRDRAGAGGGYDAAGDPGASPSAACSGGRSSSALSGLLLATFNSDSGRKNGHRLRSHQGHLYLRLTDSAGDVAIAAQRLVPAAGCRLRLHCRRRAAKVSRTRSRVHA